MTWVCAVCGADFLYHGPVIEDGVIVDSDIRCSKDESHQGAVSEETYKKMKEVIARQDIADMFGPEDTR